MTTPHGPPESEKLVAVSPDGRRVLISANEVVGRGKLSSATVTYRVRDVASGDLLWELPTTDTSNSMGAFSADGQRIGMQIGSSFQVWDYGKNGQIYDSPLGLKLHGAANPVPRWSAGLWKVCDLGLVHWRGVGSCRLRQPLCGDRERFVLDRRKRRRTCVTGAVAAWKGHGHRSIFPVIP